MGSIGQWIYFQIIFAYLDKEIETMRNNMMGGLIQWILLFGSIMITSWIIFQGWLVVTGRSREPMMSLVTQSMRVVLITLCATTFSFMGADISDLLTNTMPRAIAGVVTGSESSPAKSIDQSLAAMQGTFALVDAMGASSGGDGFKDQLSKITTMSAIGTAGPAVIGGALLLMYKVALGLFVGLGPLFIMCLLFQSTKSLFSKWLQYGIGTMFSLAVLSFMVGVAMKLVIAVSAAMLVKYKLVMHGMGAADGMSTIAMQQGGLGLIMSILLISCPPMAAQFFQGTLGGAFSQYSFFGNTGAKGAAAPQPRDSFGNTIGGQSAPSGLSGDRDAAPVKAQPLYARQTSGYQGSSQPENGPLPQKNFQPSGGQQ